MNKNNKKSDKIYILTKVDMEIGFGAIDAKPFSSREDAVKTMVEEYYIQLKKCGKLDDYEHDCDNNSYAYINKKFYWDIFETEMY